MRRHAVVVALLGFVLAGSGCAVYASPRRVVVAAPAPVYVAPQPVTTTTTYETWPAPAENPGSSVVVEGTPPAPYAEVVTESPGVDFAWVGGYWAWNGGWLWRPGYWHRGPVGYGWRAGGWVVRGGRSYWHGGGWVRGGRR
jgi:hypothetical protein